MKMNKNALIVAGAFLLLMLPVAMSQSEYITTIAHFNVPSNIAFTLTLPGQVAVESTGGGAATTDIEFNSTSGTEFNISACVVGGTCQSDGTPIFQYNNTGTVTINLSVALNTALPACMSLTGAQTFTGAESGGSAMSTTPVAVQNNFAAGNGVVWYMAADYSGCTYTDSTTRTITTNGTQS
ncbi:hypothetical protein JW968_01665 [Candidatus Woesearchaeota archaeon]|nr:hypothetical protein [Candidatus Woesearchaeota archaeon]